MLVSSEDEAPTYERLLSLLQKVPGSKASRSWVERVLSPDWVPGNSQKPTFTPDVSPSGYLQTSNFWEARRRRLQVMVQLLYLSNDAYQHVDILPNRQEVARVCLYVRGSCLQAHEHNQGRQLYQLSTAKQMCVCLTGQQTYTSHKAMPR